MDQTQTTVHLTKEQKTGFVLLLIFGLLTASLGFLQMRDNIYGPVLEQELVRRQDDQLPASFFTEELSLQQLDTDQDGLNDYEEVNFYKTSRYLPDTDSDGITDKQEVDRGTDPLCSEDQNCTTADEAPANTSSTLISPLFENSATAADVYGQALIDSGVAERSLDDTTELEPIANDVQAIRDLLLTTGQITREQLDRIDDATLLRLSQDLIQTQGQVEATDQAETQVAQ